MIRSLMTTNQVLRPFATAALTSRLEGKVAIVTASTEGIGYAIAERLASEGAAVVISSRKQDNVNKAVEKLRAKGFKVEGTVCHVSKAEHRSLLFDIATKKFGGLDILVSNAAVNPGVGPVVETSDEVWDKIFEINVKNAWQLTKEATPHLLKRGGGSILYVTSIAAYQPMQPLGVYSISKTALLGLIKATAKEVGPDNIRVNGLAPGVVPTKFSQAITSDSATELVLEQTALKRLGKPEDMAAAAAFLVSSDADYVTGEILVAAGGMSSHL